MEPGRRPISRPPSVTWYMGNVLLHLVLHSAYSVHRVQGAASDDVESTGFANSPGVRFLTEPESVIIWSNFTGSVTLPCVADPPDAVVRWTVNGADDVSGHVIEPGSIRFAPPPGGSWSDLGMLGGGDRAYRCLATGRVGTIVSQEAVVSLARIEPFNDSLPPSGQNLTVTEGNTAVITCATPNGLPQPLIEFEKNGKRLRIGDRQRILPSGTLQIVRVGRKDDGIYRCSAHNPVSGERLDAPNTSHLKVIAAPSSSSTTHRSPPRFLSSPPPSVTAVLGGNVTLECAADGWPVPRVNWTRRLLDQDGRHSTIFGNLVISNVRKSDEGTYVCHASSVAGEQSASTVLTVHGAPVITGPPVDQVSTEGLTVDLQCHVTGAPVPDIQWFHNAIPVGTSEYVQIIGTGLSLSSVPLTASGMYQCFAKNVVGTASSSARLIVNERPTTTTVSTIATSKGRRTDVLSYQSTVRADEPAKSQRPRGRTKSSTIPLSSTTSSTEVDDYVEVTEQPATVSNEFVQSVDATFTGKVKPEPVAVPGAMEPPPQPEVTQLTDTSVLLQWTGVISNASLPVVFYKIQYQEVAANPGGTRKSRWNTVDDEILPTRHQFEVNGLKTGATYRFRLAAVYSNQDNKSGPLSDRLTLVSSTPGTRHQRGPTGAVTIVELVAQVNGTMSVGWQYDLTDRVDGFLILYKPFSENDDRDEDYKRHNVSNGRLRRAEISGLLPDTSYSFRMLCYNNAGQSDMSNAFVQKTLGGLLESSDGDFNTPRPVPLSSSSRPDFVYVPNRLSTHASNELLFVVLGVVLGSTIVTLFGIMCACACQQRRRKRILAARRGETKFHDPARSIYLNTLSKSKPHNGGTGTGFMLKNIDSGPGNRLAVNGGQDPRYSSGRWSSLVDAHPSSSYNEHSLDNKFFAEQPTLLKEYGPSAHSAVTAGDYSLERPTGSKTSLAHPDSNDQTGVIAEVITDGASDVGLIERPRDMAASSSSSSQHLPSSRSAARAVGGCSDAGSRQSSSLNRDRRTSPDHIPRLHECWSLEPVRRATNRGAGSRGATEPSSELSSLDSLPAYAGQRHTSSGICTDLGEQASLVDNVPLRGSRERVMESQTERVQRGNQGPSAMPVEAAKSSRTLPPETVPFNNFAVLHRDDLTPRGYVEQSDMPVESDFLLCDRQY